MIKVTVKGAKELAGKIRSGSKKINPVVDQNIGSVAKKTADIMKAGAPKRSGKMASSIKASRVGEMSWSVRADVDYLNIQRYGTTKKNYPIYPRNKKALYWAGLEHPIAYVKSHPGIRPKPFIDRGIEGAQAMIGALANNIVSIFKNLFSG